MRKEFDFQKDETISLGCRCLIHAFVLLIIKIWQRCDVYIPFINYTSHLKKNNRLNSLNENLILKEFKHHLFR